MQSVLYVYSCWWNIPRVYVFYCRCTNNWKTLRFGVLYTLRCVTHTTVSTFGMSNTSIVFLECSSWCDFHFLRFVLGFWRLEEDFVIGVKYWKRMSCNSYNEFYYFTPINEISQRFMCSIVDLPIVVKPKSRLPKPLGSPLELYHTQGVSISLFVICFNW